MKRSTALSLVVLAVFVAACSGLLGETPVETSPDGSNDASSTSDDDPEQSTASSTPDCIRFTGNHSTPINTGSLATDALHLSGEVFLCANDVVVVDPGDLNMVAAAAQLAAALSGPLLFPNPRLAAEIGRLDAERVHIVGAADVNAPSGADIVHHDITGAVDLARETLGVTGEMRLPATPDASTLVDTVLAIDDGDRVVFPQSTAPGNSVPPEPQIAESEVISGLAVPSESASIWMVDASRPETVLLASAYGETLGASIVAFDGDDILANPDLSSALEGRPSDSIRVVGEAPNASEWELNALANGAQLPGGGFHILPGEGERRYVAYYGHPGTPGLGVLGEQGPAETLAKMQTFLDAYAADGAQTIPTFEILASVAAGSPTEDNDYSNEWPVERFTEWIDFARENDVYVILDLQSGRDDFLTQAMMYEELLKLPNVGLALDPEWRLGPDQVPLQQIGSTNDAEVNATLEWVAQLVRENGLPQKMMIVHQFRHDMIRGRENLEAHPEIQLVIQMDGEGGAGGEATKDATYNALTADTENAIWKWGWKNFFDEDLPGPPPPENVLTKDPVPVYVSYQ